MLNNNLYRFCYKKCKNESGIILPRVRHGSSVLDFEEFIIFKNDETGLKYLENVDRLSGRDAGIPLLYQYLTEFMIFGSYPEVVLAPKPEDKIW